MRPLSLLILLILEIAACNSALAVEVTSPSNSSERVTGWVADLASDSRQVRTHAETSLIAQGHAVLDLLPSEAATDPSVREALERIVRTIEENETAAALTPRTVRFSTQLVSECVDAISAQTGNSFENRVTKSASLSVAPPTDAMTFWQAMSWLENQLPVRYRARMLQDVGSHNAHFPVDLHEAFRVQVVDRTVRTTSSGARLLRLNMRIECEPRLRPLFLMAAVDSWKVTMGGNVLSPFTPGAKREIAAGKDGETEIAYDFVLPPDIPTGPLKVSGQIQQTLSARTMQVTFTDLNARLPLVRRRGQVTLTLLAILPREGQVAVRLALAYPESKGLFESYRSSLLAPQVTLRDSQGRTAHPQEMSQVQEDPDGNILQAVFETTETNLRDTRLSAAIPTAISTQTVSFEFENLEVMAESDRTSD